jgi:hypothetical protein
MEGNTWKTWVGVILICLGMAAGVLYLRPDLKERFFPSAPEEVTAANDAPASKKAKRKKSRTRKKSSRRSAEDNSTRGQDDEEFVDDYVAEDRFAVGDIFADEPDEPEPIAAPPEPAFVPPKEMWQPTGTYRPAARYVAPGASNDDVVEISMSGGPSSPLTPGQISSTLSARTLMPCYDEVARKVPEMEGNVNFRIQVEGNGKPSKVEVTRSQLRSRQVETCMVERIQRLRFPKSTGDRRTRFDIDFTFH